MSTDISGTVTPDHDASQVFIIIYLFSFPYSCFWHNCANISTERSFRSLLWRAVNLLAVCHFRTTILLWSQALLVSDVRCSILCVWCYREETLLAHLKVAKILYWLKKKKEKRNKKALEIVEPINVISRRSVNQSQLDFFCVCMKGTRQRNGHTNYQIVTALGRGNNANSNDKSY